MQNLADTAPATPFLVQRQDREYAPWWHTVLLILFILGTSWLTVYSTRHAAPGAESSKVSRYVQTMVMQWLVFGYILFGLRLRGRKLREITGRTWHSFEDALLDVAIAACFWLCSAGILYVLQLALKMANKAAVADKLKNLSILAPQSGKELALFIAVAVTAGICEETMFRGYLQRQFIHWTRNAAIGIILSAALFGLAHGYQGPKMMFVLSCYGALFGILAHLRRSTLPGMLAHAWQDSLAGIVLYFRDYLPIPK